MKLAPVQPYDTISWGSKALHEKLSFNRFWTGFTKGKLSKKPIKTYMLRPPYFTFYLPPKRCQAG